MVETVSISGSCQWRMQWSVPCAVKSQLAVKFNASQAALEQFKTMDLGNIFHPVTRNLVIILLLEF